MTTVTPEIIDQVNQLMRTGFEVPPEKLNPNSLLGPDLGLDSLDAVDMLVYLEERLDVKVEGERLISVKTLNDVYMLAAESVAKSNLEAQARQ